MQTKKKEMEKKIVDAAINLFLKDGFEQTSLRKIVKKAGTSLGNFTNYFESKEALFEFIVKPAYDGFNGFLLHHDQEDENIISLSDVDAELVVRKIIKDMPFVFTDAFILLVESAKGTKYETYGDEIKAYMKRHFMEHLSEYVEAEYGEIVASMFLKGLTQIIRDNKEKELVEKLVARHILFFAMATCTMVEMEGENDSSI